MADLNTYAVMLADWQARMNLVGRSTLSVIWSRHFADSAQLVSIAPGGGIWLDIGAGAGFPGLVVALLSESKVTLVESTAKKCRFLEAVVAELGLEQQVTVRNARIEALPAFAVDVITARACAPVAQLFEWGTRFTQRSTQWLLPKGATVGAELEAARLQFDFDAELVPSRTDDRGRIVVARDVRRRIRRG